jgi:hypothetical protein
MLNNLNLSGRLKTAIGNESSKINANQGFEGVMSTNKFISSIPTNEEDNNENIIKRPMKTSKTTKLIGKKTIKKPIGKLTSMKPIMGEEGETTEATSAGSAGGYEAPLFSKPKRMDSMFKDEQPKKKVKGGFVYENKEKLKGGKADKKTFEDLVNKYKKHGQSISNVETMLKKQLSKGIRVEMEHTDDKGSAKEIAMDHLFENPKYYDKLEKIETKEGKNSAKKSFLKDLQTDPDYLEFKKNKMYRDDLSKQDRSFGAPNAATNDPFIQKKKYSRVKDDEGISKIEATEATSSSSSGSYVTPAAWAKSTKKKDWRGASKTQIPGGKFVQVKKKCKTFPYCNQGDINALNIFENKTLQKVITKISKEHNISEHVIKNILAYEYGKKNKQ